MELNNTRKNLAMFQAPNSHSASTRMRENINIELAQRLNRITTFKIVNLLF